MTIDNRNVQFILNKLHIANHSAFVVGGCVRDALLGINPHDFDITTSATPDEIKEIFKDFTILEIGIEFGIVVVIIDGEEFEIATFRTDGNSSDYRRPDRIELVKSIDADLSRRDFTINALAFDGNNLVDLFSGVDDIHNKIIRTVGNADERFNEDALRILRALRFASVLGFEIESDTAKAIHKNKDLLNRISKERITKEFVKIVGGNNCVSILREFRDVLSVIIPEIEDTFDFEQHNRFHVFDVFEHTLHTLDNIDELDVVTRIALLFHDIGKPNTFTLDDNGNGHFFGHPEIGVEIVKEIFKHDLRLEKKIEKEILTLIELHDAVIATTKSAVRRTLTKISAKTFDRLILVKKHDALAHGELLRNERLETIDTLAKIKNEVITEENCFKIKDLAVNGNDIIAAGVNEGKEVGVILHRLFDKVINGDIKNDRNVLLAELNR